jgi:D-alanyl-D-alanine carboxypeptidase/D-alanyl-D-alanine-endopeptidase (penicillin-binding protein 4)
LAANGIDVAGGVRRGTAPPAPRELLTYEGKPLGEIVRLMMKYSNNAIAETLCKALGAYDTGQPGSWSTGLSAIARQLGTLGVDASAFTLVDASGLGVANRVSPRGLVAALRVARTAFAFAPEFTASLPIAGADGTLQQRGGGAVARVRAKTGSIAGAAGLSGYALTADGEEVIFSILVNDYRSSDGDVIGAIDRFAAALTGASLGTDVREGKESTATTPERTP